MPHVEPHHNHMAYSTPILAHPGGRTEVGVGLRYLPMTRPLLASTLPYARTLNTTAHRIIHMGVRWVLGQYPVLYRR